MKKRYASVAYGGMDVHRKFSNVTLRDAQGEVVARHGAQARGTRTGVSPFFLSAPSGRLRSRVQSPLWGSKQKKGGSRVPAYPGLAHRGYYHAPRRG